MTQVMFGQDLWLFCEHDRHTDDKFKLFTSERQAVEHMKEQAEKRGWGDTLSTQYYGDVCIYVTDDYYMFVQKVQVQGE